MINLIIPIFRLTRPVNVLITMLSVFVAALVTGTIEPLLSVLLACLSAGLIAAAANTINDYYDVEIDRINKPGRPVASGRVSPKIALGAASFEYAAGNITAMFISPPMLLMALLFSAITFLYSAYLKRTILWGNFAVSLSTAAAFIYGGLSVNRVMEAIIPAVFGFFFHLGREIIKDMQDIEGDRRNNAQTFPVRFGIKPSITLVWINFFILIFLTLQPYLMGWYGITYFMIVVTGIYPVIAYTLISILKDTQPEHLGLLSNLLKVDMLVGLLAIYFG